MKKLNRKKIRINTLKNNFFVWEISSKFNEIFSNSGIKISDFFIVKFSMSNFILFNCFKKNNHLF